MRTRRNVLLAGAAGTVLMVSLGSAAPALAATGDVVVTDRETVQIYMTPTGKVKVARLYDQVTATGKGTVDIANPVPTDGLRNLDGLSNLEVEDGNAVATLDVDGEERLRSVSTFDEEKLPVEITPTYTLDGKVYDDPEDIVGKSGELEVKYKIENITGEPTSLTVKDGAGNDVQRTVDVPLPLAGQLITVLPKEFYSVESDQATISADGRGATKMTFTMTLLPPVGSATAEIGYKAQVVDAVIPKTSVTIAVVQPLKNPTLSSAAKSYQGGAETGATLTAGAEEIDANLLKLRDGAGDLLGGLLQLHDGAQQLNEGLAGSAAPGANKLADGAGAASVGASTLAAGLKTAATGSDDLAGGVGKLAAGNKKLAAGFNSPTGDADLVSGSQDLASGLGLISGGLAQLASVEGLPKAYAGLTSVKAAVDAQIIPGIGTTSSPCDPADKTKQTLLGCIGPIIGGLTQLGTSRSQVRSEAGLPSIQDGVDLVLNGINKNPGAVDAAGDPGLRRALELLELGLHRKADPGQDLDGAAATIKASAGCDVVCEGTVDFVFSSIKADVDNTADVVGDITAKVGAATDAPTGNPATTTLTGALNGINSGLTSAISSVNTLLVPGASGIRTGLLTLRGGLTNADANGGKSNPNCNPSVAVGAAGYCGLTEGIAQLVSGLTTAVSGVTQLSAGASTAADGSGTLAEKIAEAGDGAQQLADGGEEAAAGSKQLANGLGDAQEGSAALADGNGQIATGAGDLADGLDDAAEGSAKLSDGLGTAADGAPQLVDGAQRLSDEGTKKLVEAGNSTALDFGERYAIIAEMAEMTKDGGLPYGAPEDATGSAAYSYELAGATHEQSRNVTRGLLAIGALGLGALIASVIRGRFV